MRTRLLLSALLVLVGVGFYWMLSQEPGGHEVDTARDAEAVRTPSLLRGTEAAEDSARHRSATPSPEDTKEAGPSTATRRTVRLTVQPSNVRLKHPVKAIKAQYLVAGLNNSWNTAGLFELDEEQGALTTLVARSVPPGEYLVMVSIDYGTLTIHQNTPLSVPATPGDDIAIHVTWDTGDVDEVAHRLVVHVVDEQGEPVNGAAVIPFRRKQSARGRSLSYLLGNWTTNEHGTTTIEAPPGTCRLKVQSASHATKVTDFEMHSDHEITVSLRRGSVTWTVGPAVTDADADLFRFALYRKSGPKSWMLTETRSGMYLPVTFPRLLPSERYAVLLSARNAAAQVWIPFEDGESKNATWKPTISKGRTVVIVPPKVIPESDLRRQGVVIIYEGKISQFFTETRTLVRSKNQWVIECLADIGARVRLRWSGRTFTSVLAPHDDDNAGTALVFEEE